MATRRISVNVGGLWRTNVDLKEEANWCDLKKQIENATGIPACRQKLTPTYLLLHKKCELEEGDDVYCEWIDIPLGNHPLHEAARYGNTEAIKNWIASGADINMRNSDDETPLMCATYYFKRECVDLLLRLGADVNCVNKYGRTAFNQNRTFAIKI